MSITIVGLLVTLIGTLARWFSWNVPWVDSEDLSTFLQGVVTLAGLALAWWGRVRKGDIRLSGFRLSK